MAAVPPPAPPSTREGGGEKKVAGPLYLRDACPRHLHGGWAQLAACGHHQVCLERVLIALGGRVVPAAGTPVRCGVVGGATALTDGRCGCHGDWLLLTGGARHEILSRYGRVPVEVVDEAVRVAVAEGREVLDVLALAAEVRSDRVHRGTSWHDAWGVVRQYGSLAELRRAVSSTPDGPRMVVSARARAVGRRINGTLS
jgi:hypothetical protein